MSWSGRVGWVTPCSRGFKPLMYALGATNCKNFNYSKSGLHLSLEKNIFFDSHEKSKVQSLIL